MVATATGRRHVIRRTFGVLLVALLGCGEGLGLRVYAERDAETVLEQASAILGVPLEQGDGPIVLELVDVVPGEPAGRLLLERSCLRVVRASYSPIVVAHEIGHALGLDHVDDLRNVMAPYVGAESIELSESQRDTMEANARVLATCP
jgi:hypothetical protein